MQQTAWEKRLTNWVVKRSYVEGDLLRKVFQPLAGMRKGYDCYRIILKQLITHFWKRVVLATLLCIESCATALMRLYAFDVFSWLDFSGIQCWNAKSLILHHKTDTKLLNCTRMTSAPGLQRIKAQAAVLSMFSWTSAECRHQGPIVLTHELNQLVLVRESEVKQKPQISFAFYLVNHALF